MSFMTLLVGSDPVEQQEQKAKRKLTLLGRKKPENAGGRANFVGTFVHETKELTASNRTMTVAETQAAWSAGGERNPGRGMRISSSESLTTIVVAAWGAGTSAVGAASISAKHSPPPSLS